MWSSNIRDWLKGAIIKSTQNNQKIFLIYFPKKFNFDQMLMFLLHYHWFLYI